MASAQVAGQGLAVVTAVLLARRLGAHGFGVYAVAVAVVFVANVVTTFGTDMVLIREIARDGRLDRRGPALRLQLALTAGALTVIGVAALVVRITTGSNVVPIVVFALSLVPAVWFSVSTAVLRGLTMLRSYAASSTRAGPRC